MCKVFSLYTADPSFILNTIYDPLQALPGAIPEPAVCGPKWTKSPLPLPPLPAPPPPLSLTSSIFECSQLSGLATVLCRKNQGILYKIFKTFSESDSFL